MPVLSKPSVLEIYILKRCRENSLLLHFAYKRGAIYKILASRMSVVTAGKRDEINVILKSARESRRKFTH